MQVGLLDAQHNLPGDGDAVEEVVDETHVVYERVNVTGAQHQQSGDQLKCGERRKSSFLHKVRTQNTKSRCVFCC